MISSRRHPSSWPCDLTCVSRQHQQLSVSALLSRLMKNVNPFPSIKSTGLNSAVQSSVVHPHEGRGNVSSSYVRGIRDLKKRVINITVQRSSVRGQMRDSVGSLRHN